jgi:hypothetical protein
MQSITLLTNNFFIRYNYIRHPYLYCYKSRRLYTTRFFVIMGKYLINPFASY